MIDTHSHLDRCEGPVEDILATARTCGVTKIVTVGTDMESNRVAVEAAKQYEGVYAACGLHPHDAESLNEGLLAEMEQLCTLGEVVAVGETGLDYYRDIASHESQKEAFLAQIELAKKVDKPLIIHTREATEDTLSILEEHRGSLKIVMHCFSIPEQLDLCIDRGYYCSFAGNVTYPKADDLRKAASKVPDRLILVETDSPYLSPQGIRGRSNSPANVVETADCVSAARNIPYVELEKLVEQNAAEVFGW